jgi:hypothetical protein
MKQAKPHPNPGQELIKNQIQHLIPGNRHKTLVGNEEKRRARMQSPVRRWPPKALGEKTAPPRTWWASPPLRRPAVRRRRGRRGLGRGLAAASPDLQPPAGDAPLEGDVSLAGDAPPPSPPETRRSHHPPLFFSRRSTLASPGSVPTPTMMIFCSPSGVGGREGFSAENKNGSGVNECKILAGPVSDPRPEYPRGSGRIPGRVWCNRTRPKG